MVEETAVRERVNRYPKLRVPLPFGAFCPGCHYGLIVGLICEALEDLGVEDRSVGLAGVGCSFGAFNFFIDVDFVSCPHGRAPAMGTAIKRLYPETIVFTAQGDGDLGAIGLGCFLNAVHRGELLTTIFLNNACFGTTGGQMAPTTPLGMRTTTTSQGRNRSTTGVPFHGAELAATLETVAYSARCTVHTPSNLRQARKSIKAAFQKQVEGIGYGFVEMVSACPTNWKASPVECLTIIDNVMLPEYPLGVFKDVDSTLERRAAEGG
jgi:2-oxoglutarate ferredoxin oxidoreductase subunit beta